MSLVRQIPGFVIGTVIGAAVVAWWGHGNQPQRPGVGQVQAVEPSTVARNLTRLSGVGQMVAETKLDRLDVSAPLLLEAKLTEIGFALAGTDVETAMRRIDSLDTRAEKVAMLRGVFTRVAQDKPPYQAIQRVKRLERDLEAEGFRTLISEWTGESMAEGADFGDCYVRLLQANDVSTEIKEAWMKAYKDHPQRSRMLAHWASRLAHDSSEDAEALGSHLSGWERQEFLGNLARIRISEEQPEESWAWIERHREEIGIEKLASVFEHWLDTDDDGAIKAFDSLSDSQERLAVAAALGRRHAISRGDTKAALAWADSLPYEAERDAAHEAIYNATPRGIGAQLRLDEGVVTIGGIIDGTPAAASGLRKGDRIVGVDPGEGTFAPLGNTLDSAVDLIRGEAGTGLRLRVLRSGGETEVIELKRQQLIFSK